MRKAFGPHTSNCAPLKSKDGSIISDRALQMERWVEHYAELYQIENTISPNAVSNFPSLPVLTELDETPSVKELSIAIDMLAHGKTPGDGISAEVIQAGKHALIKPLHELLSLCWEQGMVPQELKDFNIVTIYKNKGDRSDCNNYRGISLLSIVGKAFARVVLKRLQILADRVYPESQCGFRA
uniref:Reverse transcriptase domain-containing protein n=1 Tax=Biomphalaria glabrata TaxID=6526 RepID=A0A2C9LZY7_BIOGL